MIRMKVLPGLVSCIFLFLSVSLNAQTKKRLFAGNKKVDVVVSDTTKKKDSAKIRPYSSVITPEAVTRKGVIDIHRVKADYFFEIPVELFGRDFLIVNKISKVPEKLNEAGVNKGINYENQIIHFEIDTLLNKVFARKHGGNIGVPHADEIAQSVRDNFLPSVIDFFNIEAYSVDKKNVVIKINKIFDGSSTSINNVFDNVGLNGATAIKDLSRVVAGKSFPRNVVVKSELSAKVTGVYVTIETTTNMVLLDEKPMTPRFEDRRVGYFTTPRWYFNDDQHKLEQRQLITRWRLEPKPEDLEKYKNGELVEPQKQIVYYIDPGTPKKWRQAIIDGINDWQRAFEAAGFKNAIIGKEAPADDPDFDPDDVRYSVVTYAASEKANAMGPSVVDPRSGEILEADIIWWHNVMSVLNAWIRIQTGAIDPRARTNRLSDELMAHAIRFVSSHEVGHTLGLPHNMGSSHAFPVDSLRSAAFTAKMGGTAPSIMDYARFNYVAQPQDGVTQITPSIGVYDLFSVNWGYRYLGTDPHSEMPVLNSWIRKHENDPLYRFREQQSMRDAVDPTAQSEDLGDDNIKASEYGIANLKRIVPHILQWTREEGHDYEQAGKMLNGVIGQWNQLVYHVLTNVGGIYVTPTVYGQKQDSYVHVPQQIQKKAVKFLLKEVFATPDWLFKNDIYNKSYPRKESPVGDQEYSSLMYLKNIQSFLFYDLVKDERMSRMLQDEAVNGRKAYKVVDLLDDMYKGIFAKTIQGKALDVFERNTQKGYIDALIVSIDKSAPLPSEKKLIEEAYTLNTLSCMMGRCAHKQQPADDRQARNILFYETKRVSDAISAKRGTLNRILQLFNSRKNNADLSTRYHYEDMILRIQRALNNK